MRLLSLAFAALLLTTPSPACECKASVYGTACGSRLYMTVKGDTVTLLVCGAPKNAHLQMFFGASAPTRKIRLPFSSCYAQTMGIFEITGVTDRYGRLKVSFKVPKGFRGAVYLQGVILNISKLRFVATNGGRLVCGGS
jgi:hypothetical protein